MRDGKVDRFKVDENGLTVDGYRRLEPESKKSMYLGNLIGIIIAAVIIFAALHFSESWFPDNHDLVNIALYAILAILVVYGIVEPEIMYRRYRYRMDDEKIEVRRGIVYITHAMVPIERVHQVDVSEGPINRMYGLANVNITTASVEVNESDLNVTVTDVSKTMYVATDTLNVRDSWLASSTKGGTLKRNQAVTVTGSYDTTVTTSDDNSLNATVIDRDDFDVTYTTNTEFGTNAGNDRNDDITIQEPTGGDDVMGGDQPGGDKPPAKPGDETSLPFTDVANDHWAYQDIADIYSAGLMTGTSSDTFSPELSVNRAMLVSILYRLEDASTKPADAGFTDVADDAWYADAVNWAKENNIVSGYSDALFGPEDTLTREQFAAILYRYAAYKGYDTTTRDDASLDNFTDASSISSGFDNVLLWANDKGYIGGMTETTLAPQGSTTRAQASAILLRFLRAENALSDNNQ